MENGPFEDVSPIKNGDFKATHLDVLEGTPLFHRVHICGNKLPGRAIGGSVVQGALPLQLSSYLAQVGSSTNPAEMRLEEGTYMFR